MLTQEAIMGLVIKTLRLLVKTMHAEDFAAVIGVPAETYKAFELGSYSPPDEGALSCKQIAYKACEFLGVDPKAFDNHIEWQYEVDPSAKDFDENKRRLQALAYSAST